MISLAMMAGGALLGALASAFREKKMWALFGTTGVVFLVALVLIGRLDTPVELTAYFVIALLAAMLVVGEVFREQERRRSLRRPT